MPKVPDLYLKHIAEECHYISAVSKGLSKEAFLADETLKRAIVRSLEIIGEATKKLPAAFRERHPHMQWRNMAGLRDRLIHDYVGVDYTIVRDIVTNKIPELTKQLSGIPGQK